MTLRMDLPHTGRWTMKAIVVTDQAAGTAGMKLAERPEPPVTNLTNPIRLQIAEKGAGSLNFLALLRWALVVIFLWFGGMKFTAYKAAGIAPFIEHSPIMSWLHALFGIQGASYVIGVLELSTAAALILGAFQPIFSALGAAMSAATYLITLTFFLSTPGVAEATAGGFPAISAAPGQFLLKDLVLLAASLSLFLASVRGPWLNVQKSGVDRPLRWPSFRPTRGHAADHRRRSLQSPVGGVRPRPRARPHTAAERPSE